MKFASQVFKANLTSLLPKRQILHCNLLQLHFKPKVLNFTKKIPPEKEFSRSFSGGVGFDAVVAERSRPFPTDMFGVLRIFVFAAVIGGGGTPPPYIQGMKLNRASREQACLFRL